MRARIAAQLDMTTTTTTTRAREEVSAGSMTSLTE
jgi:hypothetical protein